MVFYVCRALDPVTREGEPASQFRARVLDAFQNPIAVVAVEQACARRWRRKIDGELGDLVVVACDSAVGVVGLAAVHPKNTIINVTAPHPTVGGWRYTTP